MDTFDLLYTEGFNPNSKNYILYRTGIQKEHLAVYLISLCKYFYEWECENNTIVQKHNKTEDRETQKPVEKEKHYYQCKHCLTVYDEEVGEPENNIQPGTLFSTLPETWLCSLCESGKTEFISIPKSSLLLQSI